MKARKVKGVDPKAPLADDAQRIVAVRLDELCAFMPQAADPDEVEALHDMRIAAKRLRYALEVTYECFGPYAKTAVKHVKELQDLLGEIHDCDVQLPEAQQHLAGLAADDALVLAQRARAAKAKDLEPKAVRLAPNRAAYAGVVSYMSFLRARRELLYGRFLDQWQALERKGFRARLDYALTERPADARPGHDVATSPPPVIT